jgi:5'-3' exonuclease
MHHFGGLQWEDRHTGVIFHYLNRLLSFINKFDTTKFVFTWDSRKSYRREKVYDGYKKGKAEVKRTQEEEELWAHCFEQMHQLRKVILPALGFKNVFIQTGYEADDIIAEIVLNDCYVDYIVISDDNDLYQLLSHCRMWRLKTKKFYTHQDFYDEYGIEPEQWVQVKILVGCPGDEVPGLSGVGNQRAIAWLKGELKPGKFYHDIKFATEEYLNRNQLLVELPFPGVEVPQLDFDEHFDLDNIFSICEDYGLFTLLKDSKLRAWKELVR